MNNPLVSVCLTTYNYAHFLSETIESVLNQTFSNFELIISDNNSTDNTDEVVQPYLADKRVSYYKNAVNLGMVGNMNKCFDYVRGKYIKFLCADDKFEPTLLEKFVQVMEQHPDVCLVTSYRQIFGDTESVVQLPMAGWHSGQEIINETLTNFGWLGEPSAVMIRAENLHLGLFKSDAIWLIDAEMWLRQLTAGNCYIIPEPLCYIRVHATQVTNRVMSNYVHYFEEYYLAKAIKERDGYNFDTTGINIEQIVKKRAAKCARAMYKVMPFLYRKEKRQIFRHAFKIANAEQVLLKPFFDLFKRVFIPLPLWFDILELNGLFS